MIKLFTYAESKAVPEVSLVRLIDTIPQEATVAVVSTSNKPYNYVSVASS